jgi:hypothetical protein
MPASWMSGRRMARKLEKWRALAARERWLLVQMAVLLPVIGGALRLAGFRRTHRILAGSSVPAVAKCDGARTGASFAMAERLGQLVSIAARHGPYRATCLRQSLALWWLLRRRGASAALRIGVGKPDGRLGAHAWVELHGRVVNDSATIADTYATYDDLEHCLPRAVISRMPGVQRR